VTLGAPLDGRRIREALSAIVGTCIAGVSGVYRRYGVLATVTGRGFAAFGVLDAGPRLAARLVTMPMNEDQKELLRVQTIYKDLQSTAHKTYNAVVVSGFSQSIEPMTSFLRITPETKNGICQGLVDRWIASHASEGSLWNDLYTNVNGIPCLKIDQVRAVMAEFTAGLGQSKTSVGPYQMVNSELYLMRRGVIPRMNLSDGYRMYDDGYARQAGKVVADPQLADKILAKLPMFRAHGRGVGSYATIVVKSPTGGHIMCAYLGGTAGVGSNALPFSDVSFFDPNIGEYWFQNAADFGRFFRYVVTRVYSNYGGYQLRSFAKQVN